LAQIYETKTRKLIDTVNITKFYAKLSIRIKTNSKQKNFLENIAENLLLTPLSKDNNIPIEREVNQEAIKDTF